VQKADNLANKQRY